MQTPFKADNLCFTKRWMKQTHPHEQANKTGDKSQEGQRDRREEEQDGRRRGPQGRLARSLSGGGPAGLGLLSLAFPSNIMTSLRTADRFPSIMFTKSR